MKQQKLILRHHTSPGDIVTLTAAVRDLHKCYPGWFQTDIRTSCDGLFDFNPNITKIGDKDPEATVIECHYHLIHESGHRGLHFLFGFIEFLRDRLALPRLYLTECKGDIYLSNEEKNWKNQVAQHFGWDGPFTLINAGRKADFTAKFWGHENWQKVVDLCPEVKFVQVGESKQHHPPLTGDNVINLIDQTDTRGLVRLVYHSQLCVTPVSFLMHLAAAVPTKDDKPRPCVVMAGGREPISWAMYSHHAFFGQTGHLSCCKDGACWISRTVKLNDGKDGTQQCKMPVRLPGGEFIPKCLDMYKPEDIAYQIRLAIDARK